MEKIKKLYLVIDTQAFGFLMLAMRMKHREAELMIV